MNSKNVIKVGFLKVEVSHEIYNALNCETERVKKKNQRLKHDGLLYQEKSLEELFLETEYEPVANDDVETVAVNNAFGESLWKTIAQSLPEKDAFIITAYYKENFTDDQIAKILHLSRQAITKKRNKIELKLKFILEKYKNIF